MERCIISKSGVRVYRDYRDNIIIDRDSKVLAKKASREQYRVRGVKLSRLGSENSEDAETWNLFRGMELRNQLAEYYRAIGVTDKPSKVLFWGMDSNTAECDETLRLVLHKVERWRGKRTEPDVVILGENTVVFNESKLGSAGTFVNAWGSKKRFTKSHGIYRTKSHGIYRENAKPYFSNSFIDCFDVEGRRYYQLMRNLIIGQTYAKHIGKEFHLVALVSSKNESSNKDRFGNRLSHQEEFDRFLSYLIESSCCHLLTWEQFEKD